MLERIKEYMDKNYKTIKLDYEPLKTKEEFLKNYKMHDKGEVLVLEKLHENKIKTIALGKDLRNKNIIMKNDVPDWIALKDNDTLFCFDIKSKSSADFFGWINERGVKGYRRFSNKVEIPVHIIFILTDFEEGVDGFTGHVNILNNCKKKVMALDSNIVHIFDWNIGLPNILSKNIIKDWKNVSKGVD